MRLLNIVTACLFLGVAGCGYVEKDDWMPVQTSKQISNDPALLSRFLSGNTIMTYNDPDEGGHGTQYEYHSADGKVLLWYPGNRNLVRGEWKVEPVAAGPQIRCYRYGANTYNPVTRTRGGAWECEKQEWAYLDTALKGDPFGLASGKLPFIIPDRNLYSPKKVMQMMGRDPTTINMITNVGEL